MDISTLVEDLSLKLKAKSWKLVAAESCTGGGLSFYLTALPGSSDWFDRTYVTYSNEAKMEMLGVSEQALNEYGAVSKEVATEMAIKALERSNANLSVSITGIAGPTGGSKEKPLGLVWIGVACHSPSKNITSSYTFKGSRAQIREQAIMSALTQVLSIL